MAGDRSTKKKNYTGNVLMMSLTNLQKKRKEGGGEEMREGWRGREARRQDEGILKSIARNRQVYCFFYHCQFSESPNWVRVRARLC